MEKNIQRQDRVIEVQAQLKCLEALTSYCSDFSVVDGLGLSLLLNSLREQLNG